MRFLACLILTIMILVYWFVINLLSSLLPLWLGPIVYTLGLAIGMYLLTGVGRE
jgi:hypothetical protein